eukprot:4979480-Prymnesium_polylepis.1
MLQHTNSHLPSRRRGTTIAVEKQPILLVARALAAATPARKGAEPDALQTRGPCSHPPRCRWLCSLLNGGVATVVGKPHDDLCPWVGAAGAHPVAEVLSREDNHRRAVLVHPLARELSVVDPPVPLVVFERLP